MGSGVGSLNTARLLTSRDAAALLGRGVDRLEPTSGDTAARADDFVCFGGKDVRSPVVGEFISLASAPGVRRDRDVPFFAVAMEATPGSSDNPPRRTVSAKWEQAGTRYALTYTCVSVADTADIDARTKLLRERVAALARLVSDRVASVARL